jgi:uncharacterized protein YprB with RNaseH-like and TPR domain
MGTGMTRIVAISRKEGYYAKTHEVINISNENNPWSPPKIPDKPKYIVLDIETSGLTPWYGDSITCICSKDNDGRRFSEVNGKQMDKDEIDLIQSFLNWISSYSDDDTFLVTKNGRQFDVSFLMVRRTLLDLFDKDNDPIDLIDFDHFDLQEITSKRISLQQMAELLGCTPKSDTGKDAIKLWREERFKELKKYCMQDVETTEEVFLGWRKLQNGQM